MIALRSCLQKWSRTQRPFLGRFGTGGFTLTEDDREHLALFVAFMMVRVPSFRNYLEEAAGRLGEAMLRMAAQHPDNFEKRFLAGGNAKTAVTPERVEALRRLSLNAGTDLIVRGTRDLSLGYAFWSAMVPARILWLMRWQFLVAKDSRSPPRPLA